MSKSLSKRLLCAYALGLSLVVPPLSSAAAVEGAPEIVRVPFTRVTDGDRGMLAGVYLPSGDGPFPVIVYSHGRSATDAERSITRVPDPRGHVRYWVKKGFAVVAPIRPGYGDTHGIDREDSGVRYDMFGNCWGTPLFERSAAAASEAVLATLRWLRDQRWADAKRIVLVGASMGGLASIASAAKNPDGVVGYINFSGGTGGNGRRAPEHSCGLEAMQALMTVYGKSTLVPSLWLYAQNDSFWGTEWPRAWHDAYAVRGNPTRFVMTDAVANADGHQLLTRGGRLWSAHVDRFLQEIGF